MRRRPRQSRSSPTWSSSSGCSGRCPPSGAPVTMTLGLSRAAAARPARRNLIATDAVVPAVDRPTDWPTGRSDSDLAAVARAVTKPHSVLEAGMAADRGCVRSTAGSGGQGMQFARSWLDGSLRPDLEPYWGVHEIRGVDAHYGASAIHTGLPAYRAARQRLAAPPRGRPWRTGHSGRGGERPQGHRGLVRGRGRARFHTPAPAPCWGRSPRNIPAGRRLGAALTAAIHPHDDRPSVEPRSIVRRSRHRSRARHGKTGRQQRTP